jgi:hypothetical protein
MPWAVAAAVVGGVASADSSRKASHTQADSANAATAAQQKALDQQIELQAPRLQTGQQGLNVLSQYLGLTTPDQARKQATAQSQVFDAQAYLAANPDVANDRYYKYHPEEHYKDYGKMEGRQAFYTGADSNDPATQTQNVAPVIADNQFGSLLKPFGIEDFQKDPGYDFRMNEGAKVLQSGAAARGGLFSGGAGKALERYGQDYASNEYGKASDRYVANQTNQFNRLASVAGVGQTAANQSGAATANFGAQAGSNIIGAGMLWLPVRWGKPTPGTTPSGRGTTPTRTTS